MAESTVFDVARTSDEVAEQVFASALGAIDLMAIALGDRLGWYSALADGRPRTAAEVAQATDSSARYAREWLEQQAGVGILAVDAIDGEAYFSMDAAAAEVMTDRSSVNYLAPLARMLAAGSAKFHELVTAYREDGGVSWADYGDDMRESQSDMNRPWFESELAPALARTEVHQRLAAPGARIADVGMGGGWSSIALARAYPEATIQGFDIDPPSVALATANAAEAGVSDRTSFAETDVAALDQEGTFDVAFAFECVHDMPRPVEVLASMRRMVGPDGVVVVMDEAVADEHQVPIDDVERVMYGFSLLICLPDGKSGDGASAETGTVIRPDIMRQYAREAGFTDIEVLPTGEFGFWRFYRLL